MNLQTQRSLRGVEQDYLDPLEGFYPYTQQSDRALVHRSGLVTYEGGKPMPLTDNQINALEVLFSPTVFDVDEYTRRKGYDGEAWIFTDTRGNAFHFYRRDGIMRLGTHQGKWLKPNNPEGTGILRVRYSVHPILAWLDRLGAQITNTPSQEEE